MQYVIIGIIAAFVALLVIVYFATKKSIILDAEGTKFEIKNKGTRIKVTINDEFTVYKDMPELFRGERATVKVPDPNNKYDEEGNVIGEEKSREYEFFVKSNYLGNKIFVTIYDEKHKVVATNDPKQSK